MELSSDAYWEPGEAEIMPGRREESAFFLADGPAHARDLGFRPVISGINTPGGDRPSALQQAWNAAGQSNPLARDASRNPLEELDRLLAAAPDDNSRKNLLTLREAIKENNILQEQQQQLEMQSTLRTAVYMLETIRNYASRRNSLQSQYDSMKRDSRTAKGETLAALRRIMKTAEQGLEQFQGLRQTAAIHQPARFFKGCRTARPEGVILPVGQSGLGAEYRYQKATAGPCA